MKKILLLCLLCASPAFAQIPNLESVARKVFDSRPIDIVMLRQICDQTDALRAQFGEFDPRVQDGEIRANNIKGMFTRRIAYAVHQIDPRFGLRRKDTGARAIRPVDGASLATDVLLWRESGQVIDVMSDRNPSWGMNAGDTQPLIEWVEPLPEPGDVPPPQPAPQPAPVPIPAPAPSPIVDYSALLERIIALQESHALKLDESLIVAKDTNAHVISMDRTLTQTLGAFGKFSAKYLAPAIGGYFLAKQLAPSPAAVKP